MLIKIWELKSGELLQRLKGHKYSVEAIVITSDNQKIISGSRDSTIKIWDISKLNDKSFIDKKIKEFQKSFKMKLDGVALVPLGEEEEI